MGLSRQAVSGAKWTGAATLVTATLQFAQVAVLARLLMPEDFGLMALAMLVTGFAQAYADMGLSSAIVQRRDATDEQLSSLFWLNVVVGAGFFGVLLLVAPVVAELYSEPRLAGLVSLTALTFLIAPVGQQLFMLLQKNLRFGTLAVIDVVAAVVGVATAVVLAMHGKGVYSLAWGQLAGIAARTLALLKLGMSDWRPQFRLRRIDLAGYVRFGAYQIGERTINFLGVNLDKLLIGSLIGTHGLGLYNVTYQLVMKPVQVFNPIITRVAFPLFAMVQSDDARLRSGYLDVIRIVALALFPVYMGMIVLAEPLVLVLLGEGWRSVVSTLQTLGVLGFFYSLGNPIGSLLLAKGKVEIGFYLNIWMIILYGAAIFVGATWGVQGVALGLVIATALGLFPVGFWVRSVLVGMRASEYVTAFSPMLISASIMGACLFLVRSYGPGFTSHVVELMGLTVVGCAIYLGLVLPWQRAFLLKLKNTLH